MEGPSDAAVQDYPSQASELVLDKKTEQECVTTRQKTISSKKMLRRMIKR
jgi:hypothetical protein